MIRIHDLHGVPSDLAEAWLLDVAANLRQSDRDEIAAMSQLEPADALLTSFQLSSHAWIIRSGETPIAAFGAAPHPLPGVGCVWMLGTEGIRREAYGIARASRGYMAEMSAAYPLALWNFIDARNTVSMRWLRWGGFKLLADQPMGPEGRPFHIFARTNHV